MFARPAFLRLALHPQRPWQVNCCSEPSYDLSAVFGRLEPREIAQKNIRMNRALLRFGLIIGALCAGSCPVLGDVIITEPLGGNDVSADKCLNSTNGAAFTALGNIVLTEAATTDFAVGNNKTFILTLPSGWQFKSGVGSVSFTTSRDITAASISVGISNLTVTFSVSGTTKFDVLTISGLQVQAL